MLKTILILPDGREVSSGTDAEDAVQSITLTQCVNDSQQLNLGSTCANMLEAQIITPGGGLSIAAGEEVALYREKDGVRYAMGLFTLEEPVRPSPNIYKLTAYDRVSWLDRDLSQWLAELTGWPYRLYDFVCMVCTQCGLQLKNTEIPNGEYLIQPFSAQGITGRQLMQWAGQLAGRFCRATEDGLLELAWYTPGTVRVFSRDTQTEFSPAGESIYIIGEDVQCQHEADTLTLSGALTATDDGMGTVVLTAQSTAHCLMGGISHEDFAVHPIEKVQLRLTQSDVGAVYPDTDAPCNCYILSGNYLLTNAMAEALEPVAQTLFEQLQTVSYTPCQLKMPSDPRIHAGDILSVTDSNGVCFTTYVMTKKQSAQTDTLTCTGSYRRDSSGAVNDAQYKALTGKVLELRTDVEGLKAENRDAAGNLAMLALDVSGITTSVQAQESAVGEIKTGMTQIRQSADALAATVQSVLDDGVDKVSTQFGLTIDGSAVRIHREGFDMTNRLNENGMYIVRDSGSSSEQVMLKADADGVIATDVSVRNYLIVGNYARLEDYADGLGTARTACFYLPGGV